LRSNCRLDCRSCRLPQKTFDCFERNINSP
jgi:hypothetical protein